MVHVQAAHMVNIYEIGDFDGDGEANKANGKGSKLDKTNGECHNNTNGSSNGVVVHPNENVSNLRRHERFIESGIIFNMGFQSNFSKNGKENQK